jgi:hypothetical protein
VYDAAGRIVCCPLRFSEESVLSVLQPGIYFVAVGPGQVKKLVVLR